MNLVTVLLMLVMGEVACRLLVRDSIEGETLGSRVLLPKNWEKFALHNRKLFEQAAGDLSHLVYDPVMGWTVGPNKRSANGLYYSSLEGIRSAGEGVSFHKQTEKTRIAVVGDSYTFGEEVRYEDSWAYLLEKELGSEFEVLNFGVPGYGLGQAYLRFEEDVRQWNPQVVILSFIRHDMDRSMTVYTPLSFPLWAMPFSKLALYRHGPVRAQHEPA